MAIEDGGPAFPATEANGLNSGMWGMTIRDYFAAASLQAWLGTYGPEADHPAQHPERGAEVALKHATLAYAMADAMLAARERKDGV